MPLQVAGQLATFAKKAKKMTDELTFRIKDGRVLVYALDVARAALVVLRAGDAIGEQDGLFGVSAQSLASADGLRYDIDLEGERMLVKYVTKAGAEVEKRLAVLQPSLNEEMVASFDEFEGRKYVEAPVAVTALREGLGELDAEGTEAVSLVAEGDILTASVSGVSGESKVKLRLLEPVGGKIEATVQYDKLEAALDALSVHEREVYFGVDEQGLVRLRGRAGVATAYLAQVRE